MPRDKAAAVLFAAEIFRYALGLRRGDEGGDMFSGGCCEVGVSQSAEDRLLLEGAGEWKEP